MARMTRGIIPLRYEIWPVLLGEAALIRLQALSEFRRNIDGGPSMAAYMASMPAGWWEASSFTQYPIFDNLPTA